jgi:hypothetical protein
VKLLVFNKYDIYFKNETKNEYNMLYNKNMEKRFFPEKLKLLQYSLTLNIYKIIKKIKLN